MPIDPWPVFLHGPIHVGETGGVGHFSLFPVMVVEPREIPWVPVGLDGQRLMDSIRVRALNADEIFQFYFPYFSI